MALTAESEPAAGVPESLPGSVPAAAAAGSTGRLERLEAALEVADAEERTRAREASDRALAAAAEAEQGRKVTGRKPTKDPHAALARAQIDRDVAARRVDVMRAARAARDAAIERGEKRTAPPPCRIRAAEDTLERIERRLAAARDAIANAPSRKVNITDPDSRVMKTKDGWIQGYNSQAIVTSSQIVVACHLTPDPTDIALYQPTVQALARTLTHAGIADQPRLILADAGYCSEENLTAPGPDRLIATTKSHKQRRRVREQGHTDGPPPPGLTAIEEMEHRLRTRQGTAAYKQRSQLIEAVFGDRKHNRHIRRYRRRGLPAARSEWAFIHLAGNLLKLHQHQTATTAV